MIIYVKSSSFICQQGWLFKITIAQKCKNIFSRTLSGSIIVLVTEVLKETDE